MLAPALDGVRLTLHVLAAALWVGGQLTLAGLIPTARSLGPQAPAAMGRAFARIQWPAFAVLVATGIWNMAAAGSGTTHAWKVVLGFKVVVVLTSGVAAAAHTRARTTAGVATWGAVSSLSAVGALVLGVFLAG